MEEPSFNFNISVVGLGLIGGSYARALRQLKPNKIFGIDYNNTTLESAVEIGIIDEGYCDGSIVINKSKLIILALYPEDAIKFVKDNISNFKPGTIITDACGVKKILVEEINSILPKNIEFVGGHPMAGKESWGFECSSKDMFRNSNYIITPHTKNTEENLKLIEYMAWALGCSKVTRIDFEEHDKILTFTSQLPHILAISLMNSKSFNNNSKLFVGGSFRDATRVAEINGVLWTQLFKLNSEKLLSEIEEFEKTLSIVKAAIKSPDNGELEELLHNAYQRKRMMSKNETD
jgi:prephenate dehydrogenase